MSVEDERMQTIMILIIKGSETAAMGADLITEALSTNYARSETAWRRTDLAMGIR